MGVPPTDTAPGRRVLRVFVSSTFLDMQEEREELVKRVFPRLRRLCESRGVTWGEVDLRWGVTDEQRAEGKVLPLCLAEIRRCRPYFLGLLGRRYGWVPAEIDPALSDREEWLRGHRGSSVTELEILHGVLNDPGMAGHSFFYLRSPRSVRALPRERRSAFSELPKPEEVARHGPDGARVRASGRRSRLRVLKRRIRASGLPVRRGWADARALGARVLEDVTGVIDRLFPEGSKPDPLDREAADHEAHAASRAQVYVERAGYFERLDAHASGDGPPLVVLGESGLGKSALLANWALRLRALPGTPPVLLHFIGATPQSADGSAMLRRILAEFRRRFDIPIETPDTLDALRAAFANALHMVAAKGRVVVVLDALNQLEDRDGAPDLVWLPPMIPPGIRLVLSTLPGRPLDDLKRRGWPTMEVEPLDVPERERLIPEYLAQYAKALSPARMSRIAAAPQAANPLYLRTLLEELRLWGDHATLDERIERYLSAPTVKELYERVLRRYEDDYEEDRPGLVRDAMTLLWAARRGLSEAELLELLGSAGQPLPQAPWVSLRLAAEASLVDRSGLLAFGHEHLRSAVRDRYLGEESAQRAAHLRLADHFHRQELGPRKVDELPWQLARAGSWRRLHDLLADMKFFVAAWDANEFEVKACWSQVEAGSALRLVDALRPLIESRAPEPGTAWRAATLLDDTGHPEEALSLRRFLVRHHRQAGDPRNLHASLGNEAVILRARGDLDAAMALHKEEEMICRELGDRDGLRVSLGNQALILEEHGDLDGAMVLHGVAELICRELGNKPGLQTSLGNQANVHFRRGSLDRAMALLEECERICRALGNRDRLQGTLGNRANILFQRGDLDGSMELLKQQEQICRELGNKEGLQNSLSGQANVLYARDDFDGSMALLKAEERICREIGDKSGLQTSLGNQANILYARNDLDGAMALYKEKERLCRDLGNREGLARALAYQGAILGRSPVSRGEGLRLAEEAYRLALESGLGLLASQIRPIVEGIRFESGRR